jgi:Bacterial membrane protein YfhO
MAQAREKSRSASATTEVTAALPAPRFAFGWAALVYAACTLTLAYPALVGGFLVNPHSDQYIAGYAFREFAASTLRATGHFPLWNPYLFGGMPYIAAMHGDIFYPTFLLRMLMPTDVAMTWGFIIHVFLAGLFTYGFLRAIGYGFYGSLVGGIAYMMSGQIASYVSPGHDGKLFVSALFPLALWLLYRGIRLGKSSSWGAFALIVGLCVLSPHPQLLQYTLLTSGAYALFLAFASVDGVVLNRRVALGRLVASFVAVLVGLAIGAVQYLPVREYVAWSPRAGGLADYQTATSYAWPPEELLNSYLPQFSGMLENYWGRNIIHLHSDYVGAIVLVVAGAAFIGFRSDPKRKHLIFWLTALIISVLWSLGSATPFYHIPYAIIPGTKYFRAPATIFFVGTLAIALFACAGTERFLQRRIGEKYLIGWLAAGAIVALLASSGGLTNFAESVADPRAVDAVIANNRALIAGAWRSFAFVFLFAALGFAFLSRRIAARAAVIVLALLMTADLWTIERLYWMFSPPANVIYASNAIVDALKAESQPMRVMTLDLSRSAGPDAFVRGDALMTHRIRNVLGYHGNQLNRYNELTGDNRDPQRLFNPNVLQLVNAKYLLTNLEELPFLPNVTKVQGPVRDAAGEDIYLYRFSGDHPYAWIAPVAVKAPDDQVLATVLDARFDVRLAALFDTSANVRASNGVKALPAPLPITTTVSHYEPGNVVIDLSSPAPDSAALVVSENYYPGWNASVDGKPARIGRADYSLIGVELPPGARRVELTFTSSAYQKGKVVTWLAILIGLIALAYGIWRDRRRVG